MEIINQREEKVKLENQALHRMLLNSVETLSTNKEWKLDSYKKWWTLMKAMRLLKAICIFKEFTFYRLLVYDHLIWRICSGAMQCITEVWFSL